LRDACGVVFRGGTVETLSEGVELFGAEDIRDDAIALIIDPAADGVYAGCLGHRRSPAY
jgi:hypothetical protein